MDAIVGSVTANASASTPGTVQGAAATSVLKKALDLQASSAATLIESLPPPALATSGALGTQVNTFA